MPKSNREAAHSPPREPSKSTTLEPLLETSTTTIQKPINSAPTIITVDCASPPQNLEPTNSKPKTEPVALKIGHRNSDGTIGPESTNFNELCSTSIPRTHFMCYLHLIKR